MKKIALALSAIVLASACTIQVGPKTEDKPKPTATATQSPAPVPEENNEEEFLAVIREEIPEFVDMPDAELVEFGEVVCTDIENVTAEEDLVDYMEAFHGEVSEYLTIHDVAFFVGASIGAFCPEKASIVDGEAV